MEYTNVSALVPQGEDFDATAVNEGVWLSQGHLDAIENNLAAHASVLAEQSIQAQQAVAAQQAAEASLATANQTIADRDAAIVSKDAEIAALKAGAAAKMKDTSKENDDLGGNAVVESDTTKEARRLRELKNKK